MTNRKDRIAIFEDNINILNSVSLFLESGGYSVVGQYINGEDLSIKLENSRPNFVILDIQMPGETGISLIPKIKDFNPEIKILIQTVFDDADKISQAILAGADGYILKSDLYHKLFECIERIKYGENPMSEKIASALFQIYRNKKSSFQKTETNPAEYTFTLREKEILTLMVQGKSYKQISDDLFISYETVHSHIKNIYKKLDVSSMTEAVSMVIQKRLINL